MTAHRARVEFSAMDLAALLPVLRREPWVNYPAIAKVIEKLERAERMSDR